MFNDLLCADLGHEYKHPGDVESSAGILYRVFFASRLKNSTLDLLREIVTFTESSLNANSSGEGSMSAITSTFPKGSSVYLIFVFINLFTFSPIISWR